MVIASFLSPEAEDSLATGLALFVIFVVPAVLIVLFWLVHILPEQIAHKRNHPQFEAIRTLCLLSLVFGGLLWPIAWIWAYSKPVMHKLAYGTDKLHPEAGGRPDDGGLQIACARLEARACLTPSSKTLRADLDALEARLARQEREPLMEIILLGIYSFFVWLIFIKFKWLPWNTPWKVAVVIFPIVVIALLLLLLNIVAPTTGDVRVIKYVVPVVSQVRGRVTEVPVENNRPVKKGDVLFGIDPTPYQNEVKSLEARLASDQAKVGADHDADRGAGEAGRRAVERAQLREQLNAATEQVTSLSASLELARKRVAQNTELVAAGAGNRFDLEQSQTSVNELTAQIAAARANERQIREKLDGRVKGDLASVAQVKAQIATAVAQVKVSEAQAATTAAQLDNAQWELSQTKVLAPGNGVMVNVMLRPGILRGRHAVQRSDDVRRQRVPDLRAVQPERAAPGEHGGRGGDHARHVSRPHHQGARGLDHLGAGAGAAGRVRQPAADDRSSRRPAASR